MAQSSFVSAAQLAQFFGITPERVRQLTKDGMPMEGRGRYDFLAATRWYIQFLQQAVKRRTEPGGVGGADALRKERAAGLEIDTELKRLELARARGALVPVEWVVRLFDTVLGTCREKMMAGVSRAAPRLLGARTQGQAVAVVEEVVREALGAMSRAGAEMIESGGQRNGTAR